MTDKINEIKTSFKNQSIDITSIAIVKSNKDSFGDIIVDVKSSIGEMRITCDRGQFFY